MGVEIRNAHSSDTSAIARLIGELVEGLEETSPTTETYVRQYMSSPTSTILLAEDGGSVVGLLSYSIRPDLYHAGPTCLIEELVVLPSARDKGIGSMLMDRLISVLRETGCIEVSVSTMPDNQGAIRFYRRHGLVDQAVLLEKHLAHKRPRR
ncbi:MAG: GNAT family N-acetyltransferase [Candidatus Eisenbacteria bacterium]